ncbi:amastigote surface protein 4, partial [Trypanosoma cruzi]
GTNKDFTGIASDFLELTGENRKEELGKNKLKTQVLEECTFEGGNCPSQNAAEEGGSRSQTTVHVSRPTTVVKGSDIYMLAGNYSNKGASDGQTGGWGLMLVKGNVSTVDSKKRIYWSDTYGLPWSYKVKQNEPLMRLIGSGGSGVQMEDGTLVFPLEGTKKKEADAEEDGKTTTVSLIIHSVKDIASWKLSEGMSADGCSDPSVVKWEKDKLMMMTACDDGRRRVYESGDKGKSWTEALGTLSRVWGNKKGVKVELVGSGFTTAKIGDDRDVMLITLPVYSKKAKKDNDEKGVLHLWLTDNTHIVDIGPVSGKDDDEITASSLLYKSVEGNKDELIALYEKKKGVEETSSGMVSVLLTEQLQRVKKVLATWKKADERVSQLCTSESVGRDTLPGTACTTDGRITDGLVGFLSGNFSDKTWRDEYLGVNATLDNEGVEQVETGVKFKGRGAGAEWPVGSQGENQLYHFANYNFTLVATVSIDGEPTEGNIPLLGVLLDGEKKTTLMELSYDREKKWILLCGGETHKKHSSTWDPETKKKHHVVILLRNGNQSSAYVDGKRVGEDVPCALGNTDSKEISHFYIGGDGKSAVSTGNGEDVSVTVTNVLLYNRPLTSEEITALNTNQLSIPKLEDLKTEARDAPPPAGTEPHTLGAVSSTIHGGHQDTEEKLLKISNDAGGGGASNSAKTTMTTHSVGSQSAEQLASGGSHDVNKNVNVDSSSNGNPAVGTVGGDTKQGNGSPQIPVGISDTADANTPTTEGEGQYGPTVNPEAGVSSGENGEPTEKKMGRRKRSIHRTGN